MQRSRARRGNSIGFANLIYISNLFNVFYFLAALLMKQRLLTKKGSMKPTAAFEDTVSTPTKQRHPSTGSGTTDESSVTPSSSTGSTENLPVSLFCSPASSSSSDCSTCGSMSASQPIPSETTMSWLDCKAASGRSSPTSGEVSVGSSAASVEEAAASGVRHRRPRSDL